MDSGFVTVYKRHTPFAMSSYNQPIKNGAITFDKVGDILMYVYLYSDEPGFDWRNNIQLVRLYIGGEIINTWDTKYLIDLYPQLQGRYEYREGLSFLPIPIQMLPVKNLRYHEVELKIDGNTTNVTCHAMYAFVNEVLPNSDEIYLQIDRYNIGSEPIMIHGHVKYMVGDLPQPNIMKLDGTRVNISPVDVYRMNHTKYDDGDWGFSDKRSYSVSDIILDDAFYPLTSELLGTSMFIFSSTSSRVLVYNTNLYFGSKGSYQLLNLPASSVWTSANDGTYVYCTTIDGTFMRISKDLTVDILYITGFRVYKTYFANNKVYLIGDSAAVIYNSGNFSFLTWDGTYSVDFFDGTNIVIYSKGGDYATVINTITDTYSNDPNGRYNVVQTTGFEEYDPYSQSVSVNGDVYYSPGRGSIFRKNQETYILPKSQYSSIMYDGKEYIYLFPYVGTTIIRYSLHKRFSMFIPFCIETSTLSSGGLSMSNFKNVEFEPKSQGTLYVARYNILRIQNGMGGKLFC